MALIDVLQAGPISLLDYHCTASPADRPFVELFRQHSITYVRKGSFGCRSRGRAFELVAGSILIGYAGDEYVCTHEHHDCADENVCPSGSRQKPSSKSLPRRIGELAHCRRCLSSW